MMLIDLTPEWTDEKYRVALALNSTKNGLSIVRMNGNEYGGDVYIPYPGSDPVATLDGLIAKLQVLRLEAQKG